MRGHCKLYEIACRIRFAQVLLARGRAPLVVIDDVESCRRSFPDYDLKRHHLRSLDVRLTPTDKRAAVERCCTSSNKELWALRSLLDSLLVPSSAMHGMFNIAALCFFDIQSVHSFCVDTDNRAVVRR